MRELTARQIEKATNGKIIFGNPEATISEVAIDSRKVTAKSLFVTIIGENHDAHDFLTQVFEAGAPIALVSDPIKARKTYTNCQLENTTTAILVEDTKKALAELAKYYLGEMSLKKIAVSGSTGKTTTKDMLYYICKEKYKTARTLGNFNNEIGLPLTVFSLSEDTEVAIFEMGMSGFGEIHLLADIVRPDVAILTNIGISHIENLGSREGILKAKLEITDFFGEENLLIINESSDLLTRENTKGNYRLQTIGFDGHSEYIISEIENQGAESISFVLENGYKSNHISLPIGGTHNAINASLAIAAGLDIGVSIEEAIRGLKKIELTDKRLSVKGKNGIKVIDDTYNASPDSMRAGLDVLEATKGVRKVAILGDMFELGENSKNYHYEIGRYAAEKKIDKVIAIGENAKEIYRGASEKLEQDKVFHFATKEEFIEKLREHTGIGDVIFVKGSRGMAMEKIVSKILE